jgi:hypothetical protein
VRVPLKKNRTCGEQRGKRNRNIKDGIRGMAFGKIRVNEGSGGVFPMVSIANEYKLGTLAFRVMFPAVCGLCLLTSIYSIFIDITDCNIAVSD